MKKRFPRNFSGKHKNTNNKDQFEEKYIRLLADFENYKQRVNQERIEITKYANEGLLTDFLPTLSLLNAAVNSKNNDPTIHAYLAGFKMINDQIFNSLESKGLQIINQEQGLFDPVIHNAIEVSVNPELEEDKILKVISQGYKLNGKVIMHAKVKINKQKPIEEKETNE
jgi:molecular chaperone GrpE